MILELVLLIVFSEDKQTVEVTKLAKGKTITVYYKETLTSVTEDTYTEKFSVETDENSEQKKIELSPKIKFIREPIPAQMQI